MGSLCSRLGGWGGGGAWAADAPAHLHADDGVDEEKHGDKQAHVGQRLQQGVVQYAPKLIF